MYCRLESASPTSNAWPPPPSARKRSDSFHAILGYRCAPTQPTITTVTLTLSQYGNLFRVSDQAEWINEVSVDTELMARNSENMAQTIETVYRDGIMGGNLWFMGESVDAAINLGVDPKHSDQMDRGTVGLPHGLGTSKKVLVIANAEKQREAKEAGADEIGTIGKPGGRVDRVVHGRRGAEVDEVVHAVERSRGGSDFLFALRRRVAAASGA